MIIYRSVSKKLSIENWIIGNWKNKASSGFAIVPHSFSKYVSQLTIHYSLFY